MRIETYASLRQHVQAWRDGYLRFLVIEGRGGVGKSYTFKDVLGDQYEPSGADGGLILDNNESTVLWFSGHATPFSIYKRTEARPDAKVVFDDVDSLLNNKNSVALLKQICETGSSEVRWSTTRGREEETMRYTSTHNVALITNDVSFGGGHLSALQDRAIYIEFDPNPQELLEKTHEITENEEILDYVHENALHTSDGYSLRRVEKAIEMLTAGLNWQKVFDPLADEISYETLANQLHAAYDSGDLTREEMNERWETRTDTQPRNLYRHRSEDA